MGINGSLLGNVSVLRQVSQLPGGICVQPSEG